MFRYVRHENKVNIVRQGLADLHESQPDRQHFLCAEIGHSALRHHPEFQKRYGTTEQVPEDAKLPYMLKSHRVLGNLLGELVHHGEVKCEFLDEKGQVIDRNERGKQQGPKPPLDYREASYRLLNLVNEGSTVELSQNGNGASPNGQVPEALINDVTNTP